MKNIKTTHEELLKAIEREKEAVTERKNIEAEYLRTNGIPVGTKVIYHETFLSGKKRATPGIITNKKYIEYREVIEYTIGKITKSGKVHKSANIARWAEEKDIQVIEEK